MILNLEKPQVRQAVCNPDSAYWLRPSNEIHDQPPAVSEPLGETMNETRIAGDTPGMQTAGV